MRESILGNQQQISGLRSRKMESLFLGRERPGKEKVVEVWELKFEQVQLEKPARSQAEMLNQHWEHRSGIEETMSAWRQIR